MRVKEKKLLITFGTTTEAMAMEQVCKALKADGRLIPVPRSITAGCGLAWCADTEQEEALRTVMRENHIEPEAVLECLV